MIPIHGNADGRATYGLSRKTGLISVYLIATMISDCKELFYLFLIKLLALLSKNDYICARYVAHHAKESCK